VVLAGLILLSQSLWDLSLLEYFNERERRENWCLELDITT